MRLINVAATLAVLTLLSCNTSRIDYFERGNEYAEAGQYGMAVIMYNNTIHDAYFARATAEYKRKNYQDAIKDFSEVLKMRRDNEQALLYRGLSFLALDKIAEAKRDLERGMELGSSEAARILEERFDSRE